MKKRLWEIQHYKDNIIYLEKRMLHLQPYSIVSDSGFQRPMMTIFPNYSIPSRKWFTENIFRMYFKTYK